MQVSISGSTGFIGSAIKNDLLFKGFTVKDISRESVKLADDEFMKTCIEGSDVIINLAGAPIQKRWTEDYKKEILNSRVETTRKISKSILMAEKRPELFISASAIGIYNSVCQHDEQSQNFASDFLGEVCKAWEKEALEAYGSTRIVNFRIGVVMGKEGGMLKKVYPLFNKGLGGKIGKGDQIMSWIHINDLVSIIKFIIDNKSISGVVNVVSPIPVSNEHFTETFGKVLIQPAFMKVPLFGLKLLYGESAEMLVTGQTVIPKKLMENGFEFAYPTIEKALVNLYK